MWNTMHYKPDSGRKIVALYNDGSGARMFFVYDEGFIDCEGDDYTSLKNYDRWAYLPDDVEFWCENRSEDPMTLSSSAAHRSDAPDLDAANEIERLREENAQLNDIIDDYVAQCSAAGQS